MRSIGITVFLTSRISQRFSLFFLLVSFTVCYKDHGACLKILMLLKMLEYMNKLLSTLKPALFKYCLL